MEILKYIIKWSNENAGFLGLLLFIGSIATGLLTGLFKSLIRKPKIKIRFIDKLLFYSFFLTGEEWFNKELDETFELHKTVFVVYMSVANIGTSATSIDKIQLGYHKNNSKAFRKEVVWLNQWHSIATFKIPISKDKLVEVQSLRVKDYPNSEKNKDRLDVGSSMVGVAYFEQQTAWGNYSPLSTNKDSVKILIRITDVYNRRYTFKAKLKRLDIQDARKYNPYLGAVEYTLKH